MDYLNDDKLEEMGYIKEIDTLAIVEKVSKIKEKKKKETTKMDPIWWTREKACLSIGDLFCTILTKR